MFNIFQTHPYTSYSPPKIIFGPETVKGVAEEVGLLGGTKVFIVTDRGVEKAGLLRPVLESLEAGPMRSGRARTDGSCCGRSDSNISI
jgi:alcohol dehydrogenase class IV